jgi:hypothetical protein
MSERPTRKSTFHWLGPAEDEEPFEKLPPTARVVMPVASQRRAARSVHKTERSRRTSRHVSRSAGGMHRRRNKHYG